VAVTFLGLTFGDDGTGWQWTTLDLIREAMAKELRELRGIANLQTQPGSLYGDFIDINARGVDLAGQGASEAVGRTIFTSAEDVVLDQMLADYLVRVVASASTATIFAYGTAGAVVPLGTAVRTSAVATPFLFDSGVAMPAAPSAAYAIEIENFAAGLYSGQNFTITVAGTPTTVVAGGATTGRQMRDALVTAVGNLALSQEPWLGGQNPTNSTWALLVIDSAGGPFALSVAGPVGAIVAYVSRPRSATANVLGATYASAESLRVATNPAGIQGFVNIEDAAVGRIRETDSQFRARHQVAQRGLGGGSPDAIRAVILADVAAGGGGATFCAVEYNPDDATDTAGNVEHSVRIVIAQDDSGQNAANALWRAKAAGDNTNGPELFVVVDGAGGNQNINIDRLTDLWIAVDIELTIGTDWPVTGDPLTQVRQDVTDYIEALQPTNLGVRITDLPIAVYPNGLPRGVTSFIARLGSDTTQGGPYTYLDYYPIPEADAVAASVTMSSRQKARAQIADVTAIIV
jgi:hypothetical protein